MVRIRAATFGPASPQTVGLSGPQAFLWVLGRKFGYLRAFCGLWKMAKNINCNNIDKFTVCYHLHGPIRLIMPFKGIIWCLELIFWPHSVSEIFISVGLRASIQSIFCGPCVGFEMKFYVGCGPWEPEKVAALFHTPVKNLPKQVQKWHPFKRVRRCIVMATRWFGSYWSPNCTIEMTVLTKQLYAFACIVLIITYHLTLFLAGSWIPLFLAGGRIRPPRRSRDLPVRFSKFKKYSNSLKLNSIF